MSGTRRLWGWPQVALPLVGVLLLAGPLAGAAVTHGASPAFGATRDLRALAQLSEAERSLAQQVDQARSVRGIRSLDSREGLSEVARDWAAQMARSGVLRHNPRLTAQVDNWRWIGENVGFGPDVRTVQEAFMRSPGHRANVLDRDYTQVGVGVVRRDGRVWVVQVFRRPLR